MVIGFIVILNIQYTGLKNNKEGEPVDFVGCYSMRINGLKGAGFAALILIVSLLACHGGYTWNTSRLTRGLSDPCDYGVTDIYAKVLDPQCQILEDSEKDILLTDEIQPDINIVKHVSSDQM